MKAMGFNRGFSRQRPRAAWHRAEKLYAREVRAANFAARPYVELTRYGNSGYPLKPAKEGVPSN